MFFYIFLINLAIETAVTRTQLNRPDNTKGKRFVSTGIYDFETKPHAIFAKDFFCRSCNRYGDLCVIECETKEQRNKSGRLHLNGTAFNPLSLSKPSSEGGVLQNSEGRAVKQDIKSQ